jgi:hypothetical protein
MPLLRFATAEVSSASIAARSDYPFAQPYGISDVRSANVSLRRPQVRVTIGTEQSHPVSRLVKLSLVRSRGRGMRMVEQFRCQATDKVLKVCHPGCKSLFLSDGRLRDYADSHRNWLEPDPKSCLLSEMRSRSSRFGQRGWTYQAEG